ncbi:MAG: hypothetical protein EYC62_07625 [Alphaproteobacteria bacterium]|nr:MAG: hypothetical protein EYC62_07625 [Alphaproteobacteria bacterium]
MADTKKPAKGKDSRVEVKIPGAKVTVESTTKKSKPKAPKASVEAQPKPRAEKPKTSKPAATKESKGKAAVSSKTASASPKAKTEKVGRNPQIIPSVGQATAIPSKRKPMPAEQAAAARRNGGKRQSAAVTTSPSLLNATEQPLSQISFVTPDGAQHTQTVYGPSSVTQIPPLYLETNSALQNQSARTGNELPSVFIAGSFLPEGVAAASLNAPDANGIYTVNLGSNAAQPAAPVAAAPVNNAAPAPAPAPAPAVATPAVNPTTNAAPGSNTAVPAPAVNTATPATNATPAPAAPSGPTPAVNPAAPVQIPAVNAVGATPTITTGATSSFAAKPPARHGFSVWGVTKTALACGLLGAIVTPFIPFVAAAIVPSVFIGGAAIVPSVLIGGVAGLGIGAVGGAIGEGLNVTRNSNGPGNKALKIALGATLFLSGFLGLGQLLKQNDIDGNRSAKVFLKQSDREKSAVKKMPQEGPAESAWLRKQKEDAANAAAVKAAADKAAEGKAADASTTAPAPKAEDKTAVQTPVAEAPSITSGQSTLSVRYMPLEAVLDAKDRVIGMKFMTYEASPSGGLQWVDGITPDGKPVKGVKGERYGIYYGKNDVRWGDTGFSADIAREMAAVKKVTLISQTPDEQRVMLDSQKDGKQRVATVNLQTGAVTAIADATQEDINGITNRKPVPYLSANKLLQDRTGAPILVLDSTATFTQNGGKNIVDTANGKVVINGDKVNIMVEDSATKKIEFVPATRDDVDTARFLQRQWKRISMAPAAQVNSQLALMGLQGTFRQRGSA